MTTKGIVTIKAELHKTKKIERILLRRGDETLQALEADISTKEGRDKAVEQIASTLPRLNKAELERTLLALVPTEKKEENLDKLAEIDPKNIVRPERILRKGYSAIEFTVQKSTQESGLVCISMLAISDNGKRDTIITGNHKVSTGEELIVYPARNSKSPGKHFCQLTWSKESREKWLKGELKVVPQDVFKSLVELLEELVWFKDDEMYNVVACWIIMTYFVPAWSTVPYIILNGVAGSGKTTLLKVLSQLCFKPTKSSFMTSSVLFRHLHMHGGTLILDELESLAKMKGPVDDLLPMLLGGNSAGSTVDKSEKVGDTFQPCKFEVYGPKALASIEDLPGALIQRSLLIQMFKTPDGTKLKRSTDLEAEIKSIVDNLHILALEHGNAVLDAKVEDGHLMNREKDVWRPIFQIAAAFSPSELQSLTECGGSMDSVKAEAAIPNDHIIVIDATYSQFGTFGKGPTIKSVADKIKEGKELQINAREVARMLRKLGIEVEKQGGNVSVIDSEDVFKKKIEKVYKGYFQDSEADTADDTAPGKPEGPNENPGGFCWLSNRSPLKRQQYAQS